MIMSVDLTFRPDSFDNQNPYEGDWIDSTASLVRQYVVCGGFLNRAFNLVGVKAVTLVLTDKKPRGSNFVQLEAVDGSTAMLKVDGRKKVFTYPGLQDLLRGFPLDKPFYGWVEL